MRALVLKKGDPSDVSRMHRIEQSRGLVSVLGGKITGYRAIAEETVDVVARSLGNSAPCRTAEAPLPDPPVITGSLESFVREVVREHECVRLTDLLFRRTSLGFAPDQGRSVAGTVLESMAEELGWPPERRTQELSLLEAHYGRTSVARSMSAGPR